MTDNEIIKALECCSKNVCKNCPYEYEKHIYMCIKNLIEKSFDLINRQKAEIERLGKEITEYKLRLKMSNVTVDEIKSEAIKEFAGTVRRYIKSYCNPYGKPTLDYDTSVKIMHFIDNLVKEMSEVSE